MYQEQYVQSACVCCCGRIKIYVCLWFNPGCVVVRETVHKLVIVAMCRVLFGYMFTFAFLVIAADL